MGRGRASPTRWLVLTIVCAWSAPALSLHLIGCLYEDLCEDTERCFNDGGFGQCVATFADPEELTRVQLSHDDLAEMATTLETLVAQGHRWSHIYTQCVLQTKLLALQTGERLDGSACELVNSHPGGWLPGSFPGSRAAPAIDVTHQPYTPPQTYKNDDGRTIFSPDERPPGSIRPDIYRRVGEAAVREDYRMRPPLELNWPPESGEIPDGGAQTFAVMPSEGEGLMKRSPADSWEVQETPETGRPSSTEQLRQLIKLIDEIEVLAELQAAKNFLEEARLEKQKRWREVDGSALASLEREAADRRRKGALAQALLLPNDAELVMGYPAEPLDEYGGVYDAAPIPLSVRSDPEFQRAERLDIKKPGPWFGVNNYAFDYDFDGKVPMIEEFGDLDRLPIEPMDPATPEPENRGHDDPAPADPALAVDDESRRVDEMATDVTRSDALAPEQATPSPVAIHVDRRANDQLGEAPLGADKFVRHRDPKDAIDDSYVFVRVKNAFQHEKEGEQLVAKIEQNLALPGGTFDKIRVMGDLVKFRVNKNPLQYNSSTVVSKIDNLRAPLESQLGVVMVETGRGDGTSDGTSSVLLERAQRTVLVQTLSIVLGVLVAVVLLVVVIVFVLRRTRASSKDKIKQLSNPDTEASKDYQELCRSRKAQVAEKEQAEKPQRVHSLSKESDGTASPTSRSSTSSWSEEPVVSNMDISTGHMVLSYMEDHLKRKDKLEQEWRALCAYEAEPSARTIAALPENVQKNRSPAVLPYDHSRVTLNAMTNATGESYINASSITDHDPRNPAYIATQGPLPNTANDFWQMVWEQGSVVIVMLTRLTENGVSMVHRYWPEEGSELYHIYEVHLVSEHIWCDEYLVRSFYLKNLKTSETRTVTQFHFLAWPENGVPTSTKALLEFRRKVNKSYRGRSCPVIVHCSDGAGRTGTYCLIDMVLNRMSKGAKEIDIAASLEHIRDQRPTMVHTRAQFEFVLMAVAEEVHAILKALPQ